MSAATTDELMTVALARTLGDGEIGFVGVGSSGRAYTLVTAIPLAAAHLARRRGVDFDVQIGPLITPDLERPPTSWRDNAVYGWQASALIGSDANLDAFARGTVSVGFVSGAQIDRWGNVNVSRVRGPAGAWKRLGGALALPEHCAFAGRAVLIADLSARVFVEQVDFVTGFGHRRGDVTRADLQLPGGGPALVVSDLALFDFAERGMRVTALYPGVALADVQERLGFEPDVAHGLAELDAPTDEELELLRQLELPSLED
jgi:glutaconate CoA-transferase subunit B